MVAENKDVQAQLKDMADKGVKLNACVTCANMYCVADELKALCINVDIMGAPLTNALKADDTSVLTFYITLNYHLKFIIIMKRACKMLHPRRILKYVRVQYYTAKNKQF
jgi:hypothetical protein